MPCHLEKCQREDTGPRGAGSEKGLDGVSFPVERTLKKRKPRTFKTNVHSCWNLIKHSYRHQGPHPTSALAPGMAQKPALCWHVMRGFFIPTTDTLLSVVATVLSSRDKKMNHRETLL